MQARSNKKSAQKSFPITCVAFLSHLRKMRTVWRSERVEMTSRALELYRPTRCRNSQTNLLKASINENGAHYAQRFIDSKHALLFFAVHMIERDDVGSQRDYSPFMIWRILAPRTSTVICQKRVANETDSAVALSLCIASRQPVLREYEE